MPSKVCHSFYRKKNQNVFGQNSLTKTDNLDRTYTTNCTVIGFIVQFIKSMAFCRCVFLF